MLGVLLIAVAAAVACRRLTGPVLRWLERLPPPAAHSLFLAAYVAVSFPVMVGMMVLNLAAGYLFGLYRGLALCLGGGVLGAVIATEACRHTCRSPVQRLQRDYENLKQVRDGGDRGTYVCFSSALWEWVWGSLQLCPSFFLIVPLPPPGQPCDRGQERLSHHRHDAPDLCALWAAERPLLGASARRRGPARAHQCDTAQPAPALTCPLFLADGKDYKEALRPGDLLWPLPHDGT